MQYAHALGLKEGQVLKEGFVWRAWRCSTGATVGGFLFFLSLARGHSRERRPCSMRSQAFVCCFRFRFPIRMPKGMGRCQASLLKSFRPGEVQSQSCEWHILLSKTGGMILQYRSIYR